MGDSLVSTPYCRGRQKALDRRALLEVLGNDLVYVRGLDPGVQYAIRVDEYGRAKVAGAEAGSRGQRKTAEELIPFKALRESLEYRRAAQLSTGTPRVSGRPGLGAYKYMSGRFGHKSSHCSSEREAYCHVPSRP
jgi:hypothetical protein